VNPDPPASPTSKRAPLTLDLGQGQTLELVYVPAGGFQMGSPDDETDRDSDEPLHAVRIGRPFYLGRFEVTQAQWEAVMEQQPSHFVGDGRRPVESVRWEDCQSFCQRLSKLTGQAVRLPTEAQWEYACRAGTQTRYSGGDQLDVERVNFDWTEGLAGEGIPPGETIPVDRTVANPWGLHGMHGNVREWCRDWYAPYPVDAAPRVDPQGPPRGPQRVLRGGCWDDYSRRCRSAFRHGFRPGDRESCNGLRIMVEIAPSAETGEAGHSGE
jgi:formylglycine-generating enzyme required for sulfatase activity